MGCCSNGMAFYEVSENKILVCQEKNDPGWLTILVCIYRFFGRISLFKSHMRTTCQKHVSGRFDMAIEHLRKNNDWSASPICGLEYLPEKELVKMIRDKK